MVRSNLRCYVKADIVNTELSSVRNFTCAKCIIHTNTTLNIMHPVALDTKHPGHLHYKEALETKRNEKCVCSEKKCHNIINNISYYDYHNIVNVIRVFSKLLLQFVHFGIAATSSNRNKMHRANVEACWLVRLQIAPIQNGCTREHSRAPTRM